MNSNLQIISGRLRGKKLHLPADARPTQNKARIALFNMLSDDAPKIVWDAFAGSGAFGMECISRWPNAKVIFTDISSDSIKTIKKNLGNEKSATILQTDAIAAMSRFGTTADLIFVDPPYSDALLGEKFIKKLAEVAKPDTVIIWEMEKNFNLPTLPENLQIVKDKTYGRARFLIISVCG